MKNNVSQKPERRTYTIQLDPESKELMFFCEIGDNPDSPGYKTFRQVYNLDMIPFEMAMNQICEVLYPRNPQSYAVRK